MIGHRKYPLWSRLIITAVMLMTVSGCALPARVLTDNCSYDYGWPQLLHDNRRSSMTASSARAFMKQEWTHVYNEAIRSVVALPCFVSREQFFLIKDVDPSTLAVAAFRSSDARKTWERKYSKNEVAESSIFLAGSGAVVVRAVRDKKAVVECIDLSSGKDKWTREYDIGLMRVMASEDRVVLMSEQELVVLDSQRGNTIKRFELPEQYARGNERSVGSSASFLFDDDKVFLGYPGGITCLSIATDGVLWNMDYPSEYGGAGSNLTSCESGLIAVQAVIGTKVSNRRLALIDKTNGVIRWVVPLESDIRCLPALSESGILAVRMSGKRTDKVRPQEYEVTVTAIEPESGAEKQLITFDYDITSMSRGAGSIPIVVKDQMMFTVGNGDLLQIDIKKGVIIGKYEVGGYDRCVSAGYGRVFVSSHNSQMVPSPEVKTSSRITCLK